MSNRPPPPAGGPRRLHDCLDQWALRRPESEAAIDSQRRLTYASLKAAVDECAAAMMASGVGRGDRVAVLATPGTDFLVTFLAAASIGAIWVGLNPRYADAELDAVIARIEPRLVLAHTTIDARSYRAWLERLPDAVLPIDLDQRSTEGVRVVDLPGFLSRAAAVPPEDLRRRCEQTEPADPCLIVFTSGSTGAPKGAMISHAALVGASEVQFRVWPAEPLRILNNLPVNHIGCVGDLTCYALVAGGTVVFSPRFDPAESLALIRNERVTVWAQVPTMFQLTLDSPAFDREALEGLQLIFWGGAHAPAELVARLHELCPRLATSYGQTETVGSVTFTPPDATIEMLSSTVGRPVPPYELRIAAESGEAAPTGESGEIEVRTPFGMSGYWRDPQATEGILNAQGWRGTGDVGALTPEGDLRLLGRVHDVFKSGGYYIYPPEIEAALQTHPDVVQASVVGAPDPLFGTVAVAFVVARGAAPVEEPIRTYLRDRVANYKIPKRIFFVDELPRLPVGKVDKQALRERFLQDKQAPP